MIVDEGTIGVPVKEAGKPAGVIGGVAVDAAVVAGGPGGPGGPGGAGGAGGAVMTPRLESIPLDPAVAVMVEVKPPVVPAVVGTVEVVRVAAVVGAVAGGGAAPPPSPPIPWEGAL